MSPIVCDLGKVAECGYLSIIASPCGLEISIGGWGKHPAGKGILFTRLHGSIERVLSHIPQNSGPAYGFGRHSGGQWDAPMLANAPVRSLTGTTNRSSPGNPDDRPLPVRESHLLRFAWLMRGALRRRGIVRPGSAQSPGKQSPRKVPAHSRAATGSHRDWNQGPHLMLFGE